MGQHPSLVPSLSSHVLARSDAAGFIPHERNHIHIASPKAGVV